MDSIEEKSLITIIVFNRLTGHGVKKLYRKYKGITKQFIYIDTKLNNASDKIHKTGYIKFVIRSIYARRQQLFQRWKEILVWILYFPLYFNRHLKKYYT